LEHKNISAVKTKILEAKGQHGGAREGGGRRKGSVARRLIELRDLSQRAIKSAKRIPLAGMLHYMNRFDDEAEALYEKLLDLRKVNTSKMSKKSQDEHKDKLREAWSLFRECTLDAHKFAVDAAPFVHQRLSAATIAVTTENITKPAGDMTEEQKADYFNKLRLRPASHVPMQVTLDNETGEVVNGE
jgi:hypothetical protein